MAFLWVKQVKKSATSKAIFCPISLTLITNNVGKSKLILMAKIMKKFKNSNVDRKQIGNWCTSILVLNKFDFSHSKTRYFINLSKIVSFFWWENLYKKRVVWHCLSIRNPSTKTCYYHIGCVFTRALKMSVKTFFAWWA